MKTTALNLKSPPLWLTIHLACHRQDAAITFTITFCNTQRTAQEFSFSNRAQKAELLGLLVEEASGGRVMPKHNLVIKPLQPDPDQHVVEGGSTLAHELTGTLTAQWLEFPGALFELQPGRTYRIRFRYAGVVSNSVTFLC